jgi:hypothetical protein
MAVEFCYSFRLLSLNSKERASADLSERHVEWANARAVCGRQRPL